MTRGRPRLTPEQREAAAERRRAIARLQYTNALATIGREAIRAQQRARRQSLREKMGEEAYLAHRREQRKASWQRVGDRRHGQFNTAKSSAKARGLEFTITFEEIYWPSHCPVFGIELAYSPEPRGAPQPNSPSLDRRDNSKGYVPGNVCVISQRANQLKRDMTAAELRALADYTEHGIW